VYFFIVCFVSSYKDGKVYDGIGRLKFHAPDLIQLIVKDDMWSGWSYFFIDTAIFWVSMIIVFCISSIFLREEV
jgi:hypothetical protein